MDAVEYRGGGGAGDAGGGMMELSKEDHPIEPFPCPDCGHVSDRAMMIGDTGPQPPEPGDWNVCLQCGLLSIYRADGKPTRASLFEKAILSPAHKERLAQIETERHWVMATKVAE